MRAGTLRDRVTVQRLATEQDAQWGPVGDWFDAGIYWANVTAIGATERAGVVGVQSEISHVVRMRYTPDVSDQDRLVYRGRILDIVSANDADGRRRELVIEAKEHPTNE